MPKRKLVVHLEAYPVNCIHGIGTTLRAIYDPNGKEDIHTTWTGALNSEHLDKFDIYFSIFMTETQICLGKNEWTDKFIRKEHNFEKIVIAIVWDHHFPNQPSIIEE